MTWIVYSLLMFLFSVTLYLLVRKIQLLKIPLELNNLFQFITGPFLFFVLSIISGASLLLSFKYIFVLLIGAFFLSYLGSLFILKGMSYAPNPGYSLVIGKSYVLYTTLVAVFLFHSELTIKRISAISIIIFFSALISVSKKTKKGNIRWVFFSFGSFFCWGTLALLSKWLIDQSINIFVILFYLTSFVSLIILFEIKQKNIKFHLRRSYFAMLILIGITSSLFNLFMQFGYKVAPNPGYISAVNASSISLVTLLAALFFKDEFSIKKFVGVIGVTLGLVLLLI